MSTAKSAQLSFRKDLGLFTNISTLDEPIQENAPVHFRFYNFTESVQNAVVSFLDKYLLLLDLIFLRDSVLAALKESITNAVKANVKRVYFQKDQANIMDGAQYEKKIRDFKSEYLSKKEEFESLLLETNYLVLVSFIHNKELLRIRIMNNVQLTPEEIARIKDKLQKANRYQDIAEAFMEAGDDLEGAGLGLIMTMMMLKNDGLNSNSFKFESAGEKTSVTIDIPINTGLNNPQVQKADGILKEIEHLPTFPKTIQDIQSAIDKPNSSIADIASMIKRDVSLSASILKLANSAAFRRGDRVESLDRAIQLIGLKELQSLLYSLGTKQIMEDKFPAFATIWDKSNECAYYCKLIAKKMALSKEATSNLMSAALLHDIGEIILLSLESDTYGSIQKYSSSKELSSTLSMEESSFGITHTKLGAMIAEKWFFPDLYGKTMEYHHKPLQTPEAFRDIVYAIYLGDMMIKINQQEAKASEIPQDVLTRCKFASTGEFQSFRTKAAEEFKNL
jgi:HD-like signal output (HDOD) protein